jgi:hypothetical protein
MTRTMLVVVTALTLAVGALSVTGGIGSGWATTEVSAVVFDTDPAGGGGN